MTTNYIYDEQGVLLNLDSKLTSYYFGGAYEVSGNDIKKYYSFSGQTILRDSNGLQYFLTDHLGSVVAVTNAAGTLTSQQRYLPFGGVRKLPNYATTTQTTDLSYTGQRDLGMGLMDYHARFYSPLLGRFISPDTITPDMTQGLNRYSYVINNPLRYSDPTGHRNCEEDGYNCPGDKTPGELILLHVNNSSDPDETWSEQERAIDALAQEIDDYLRNHPDYDMMKDQRLRSMYGGFGAYESYRQTYWENRTEESGLCTNSHGYLDGSCVYQTAYNLRQYYDNHETLSVTYWDANSVNWPSVTLDAAGIPLGAIGLGGPLKFGGLGKTILGITGAADSAVSFESARRSQDRIGQFLAAGSAFPLVGAFFSGGALGYDLGKGFNSYEWTPPIPR